MHTRMKESEEAYEGNIKCVVEKGYEKYVPPTSSALVDTDVDHIITRNPIVTCPPLAETAKGQTTADKLEKLGMSILSYNTSHNPMPPAKSAAKDAAIYGLFCFKGPIYNELPPDSEDYYGQKFPIIFRTVNPMSLLPSPTCFWFGEGPVIEVKKKTVAEVKMLWPKYKPGNKKDDDELELVEYWSIRWKAYIADGQPVEIVPNVYGYVPYEIGFSGLGRIGVKPEELAVGLLYRVLQSLEIEARTVSAIDAIVQNHAYIKLACEIPPEELKLTTGPGGIVYVPKEANIHPLYEMKVPPFLYDHLGNIRSSIREATYSKVVQGENPPGTTSGYHQRLNISEVRLKFGDVKDNIQFKLGNILGKSAYMIEHLIRKPVSIWGSLHNKHYEETIGPEDIKGHHVFNIDLSETTPEEAERRIMVGSQLLEKGHITFKDFLEHFRREADVNGYIKQQMVERVLNSPMIQEALAASAAQQWGLDQYIAQAQAQLKTNQSGSQMPFVGGAPGTPQPAAPGSPEELDLMMRQQMMMTPPGAGNRLPERGRYVG